jgi:Xaa-Pro aminopeptidase
MSGPEIPKSEYPQRVEKVRKLMRAHKVDAVVIYHDEYYMSNGCYLTNYWPIIEAGAVLVPMEGEPLLLGGPEAMGYALEVSAIQTWRSVDAFIVPEEEYPGAVIEPLGDVLKETTGDKPLRRLGVVGYDVTPYGLIRAIQEALPGVELVDMTRDYEVMRAVKSEAEIAVMSFAFDAGAEGEKAAIPTIKAGATEYEVIGAAEGRMRSMGIDGWNFRGMAASGPRSNGVVPPASFKQLQDGELVLVGFSPKYRGYSSGVAATYAVNHPPTDEQLKFLGHLAQALRVTRDALRPGVRGREIDAITRGFLSDLGYGPYLSMGFVHTVGLNEFERPFFGPNSEDVLEVNLTVCLDISMFHHPVFHGARIETGYVIRESGAEPLSQNLEDLLFSLGQPDGLWSVGRS